MGWLAGWLAGLGLQRVPNSVPEGRERESGPTNPALHTLSAQGPTLPCLPSPRAAVPVSGGRGPSGDLCAVARGPGVSARLLLHRPSALNFGPADGPSHCGPRWATCRWVAYPSPGCGSFAAHARGSRCFRLGLLRGWRAPHSSLPGQRRAQRPAPGWSTGGGGTGPLPSFLVLPPGRKELRSLRPRSLLLLTIDELSFFSAGRLLQAALPPPCPGFCRAAASTLPLHA